MVRSELLQKMCNLHPNIIRKDMEKILEIIFLEMTDALCAGKNIEIRGFGRVTTKIQKPRMGRNPKTGKEAVISERSVIIYNASEKLKLRLKFRHNW